MQKYLLIALGGALGAVARYSVDVAVADRLGARFPYGTLAVNITACFLIGFFLVFLSARTGLSPAWRYLIAIGFIGSYSTFSTFEWEAFAGFQSGALFSAIAYVGLSVVVGLLAVWGGIAVARKVSPVPAGFDRGGRSQLHYRVNLPYENTGLYQASSAEGCAAEAERGGYMDPRRRVL